MKKRSSYYLFCLVVFLSGISLFSSCTGTAVNTFEKNVAVPGHAWSGSFKPEITFDIQDTTASYAIYIVLRHTDAYRYKNIWLNIYMQPPAGQSRNQSLDLKLATDEKGWLGRGMDDIFEHRILIMPAQPLHGGTYHFRLENIMREDPLEHVMNVGIRLEKVS